jgi:hypothetical protein
VWRSKSISNMKESTANVHESTYVVLSVHNLLLSAHSISVLIHSLGANARRFVNRKDPVRTVFIRQSTPLH